MKSPSFHPLEQVGLLHDGYLRSFVVSGRDLVLVQQAGTPAILEGICPHAGHPFSGSKLVGADIRCDMHGYRFDIRDGRCTYYTEGPCRALRVYAHEVREGFIGVWFDGH